MTLAVASPLAGWLTGLEAVPDPVFAERMLGDGVAIDPVEGLVRAPVSGRIATLHPARHAVTLESDEGAVLLIHVGLETVALGGEGFTAHVSEGDRVTVGDPLIGFDLDAVGRRAKSLVTPIILTNGEAFSLAAPAVGRMIVTGEALFDLTPREGESRTAGSAGPAVERTLILPLRHGLHARPAARIADCARGFDAVVEIVADKSSRQPQLQVQAPRIVEGNSKQDMAAPGGIADGRDIVTLDRLVHEPLVDPPVTGSLDRVQQRLQPQPLPPVIFAQGLWHGMAAFSRTRPGNRDRPGESA